MSVDIILQLLYRWLLYHTNLNWPDVLVLIQI